VLYEAVRREHYPDATDHMESDDPDLTAILGELKDWELDYLAKRVAEEQEAR